LDRRDNRFVADAIAGWTPGPWSNRSSALFTIRAAREQLVLVVAALLGHA
jgi:hypothetical protein